MKKFIKKNLTNIERKDAGEYLNNDITNQLYDDIMGLYYFSYTKGKSQKSNMGFLKSKTFKNFVQSSYDFHQPMI